MSCDGYRNFSLEYRPEWDRDLVGAWPAMTEMRDHQEAISRGRKDWVCWQHAPLDFNYDDITFVVKAVKRMEQLLIHHYGLEVPNNRDRVDFKGEGGGVPWVQIMENELECLGDRRGHDGH